MNRTLALALAAALIFTAASPAFSKETSQAVLEDFKRHQAKKKHKPKKAQKIERVPMAKLKNCQMRRVWVAPRTIREAKICEVIR